MFIDKPCTCCNSSVLLSVCYITDRQTGQNCYNSTTLCTAVICRHAVKIHENRQKYYHNHFIRVQIIAITVSVCLSITKTTSQFHNIFCTLPVAVAQYVSDDRAIK